MCYYSVDMSSIIIRICNRMGSKDDHDFVYTIMGGDYHRRLIIQAIQAVGSDAASKNSDCVR